MRKLLILLLYAMGLLLLVSACVSTEEHTTDSPNLPAELSEEFIEKLYTVDDANIDFESMSLESVMDIQNEFIPYLTKEEFEELSNKRFLVMPEEAASNQNNSISVENVKLEQYNLDQAEEGTVDFEHSFILLFKDQEGNEVEEAELNGQLTVIETEEGFKISRYHDSKIPVDLLYP